MKKIACICVLVIMCLSLSACAKNEKEVVVKEPEITQIKSICNLATLECYYHNVARSTKTAGEGITHWGEVDREFWIEYTGVAKIGIDMSKVAMVIDGEDVRIKIPEAELIGKVDIRESGINYISSNDAFNKNQITVEDETIAIEDAQNKMQENIKNNKALLLSAQSRAQELIENYIKQMGTIAGITYKITWEYEDGTSSVEDTQESNN